MKKQDEIFGRKKKEVKRVAEKRPQTMRKWIEALKYPPKDEQRFADLKIKWMIRRRNLKLNHPRLKKEHTP
jgi:hypothetical protein